MKSNYKVICKELFEILKNTDDEVLNKIPKSLIDKIKENMDINHEFKVNSNKEMFEQDVCQDTKLLLASIYLKYICNDEERIVLESKIKDSKERLNQVYEDMKIEFNDEFFSREESNNNSKETSEITALVEVKKENIVIRLINKILSILKIK